MRDQKDLLNDKILKPVNIRHKEQIMRSNEINVYPDLQGGVTLITGSHRQALDLSEIRQALASVGYKANGTEATFSSLSDHLAGNHLTRKITMLAEGEVLTLTMAGNVPLLGSWELPTRWVHLLAPIAQAIASGAKPEFDGLGRLVATR